MTTKQRTIKALNFLLKDECLNKWIGYRSDKTTINLVVYMVNLKLVSINEHSQIKVNQHNAKLFLNNN